MDTSLPKHRTVESYGHIITKTAVKTLTLFIGYWDAVICSTVQMHCTFLKYLTLFDCCEDKRHHCFDGIRQTPGKLLGKETNTYTNIYIYIVLALNAQFINYF
jgi:hypothetical protein